MKTTHLLIAVVFLMCSLRVDARDIRTEAVLRAPMVVAILNGLVVEQDLKCQLALEEDGGESVAYFVENNRSRFSAGFLCDDGRTAVIEGILGDGQVATEEFRLVYAN